MGSSGPDAGSRQSYRDSNHRFHRGDSAQSLTRFVAGRNLPDKEFGYLRTVIVTAAVYWGFDSKLRLAPDFSC